MPRLTVSNLVKEFTTPSGPLRVLDGVSMELPGGANLAVVGPSGSGKSTLLHIIGTLDRPTAGSVQLAGADPQTLGPRELAEFRNRHIGFVFQEHHLLPQLTALENVLLPVVANGRAGLDETTRARELLEQVGLGQRIGHRPGELSGGERQRVAVARALVRQPLLLLADEPTGSLDNATAQAVGKMLLELHQRQGLMLVCVTHNDALAAQFQRTARLVNGRFSPP